MLNDTKKNSIEIKKVINQYEKLKDRTALILLSQITLSTICVGFMINHFELGARYFFLISGSMSIIIVFFSLMRLNFKWIFLGKNNKDIIDLNLVELFNQEHFYKASDVTLFIKSYKSLNEYQKCFIMDNKGDIRDKIIEGDLNTIFSRLVVKEFLEQDCKSLSLLNMYIGKIKKISKSFDKKNKYI